MKQTLLCLCLTALVAGLAAQNKLNPDAVWVGGFEENPNVAGYANYTVRFGDKGTSSDSLELGLRFESTVASWCDAEGNLLLLSNGCVITDGTGRVLENGDGLNPGEMHDMTCDKVGYIAPRGAMFLAAPGRAGIFYLIHLGIRYDPVRKIKYGPLYYSVVDLNANGGKGAVIEKNVALHVGDIEPFAVVRHGNGRDWWLATASHSSRWLFVWRIDPQGVTSQGVQELGQTMGGQRAGCNTFSLNGLRFARFHCDQGAQVYDFDRCTGVFSAGPYVKVPLPLLQGGGAAFSPDNRYLYTCSQSALYETDLLSANPRMDTAFHLFDRWDWGTSLQHLQYGPNGTLYAGTVSRANYLNSITLPAPGLKPTMNFRAVPLAAHTERTLPHFPNHNLYDWGNSPCDTLGISQTQQVAASETPQLALYPNPVQGMATVAYHLGEERSARLLIFDAIGKKTREMEVTQQAGNLELFTAGWPPGAYYLLLQTQAGNVHALRFLVL